MDNTSLRPLVSPPSFGNISSELPKGVGIHTSVDYINRRGQTIVHGWIFWHFELKQLPDSRRQKHTAFSKGVHQVAAGLVKAFGDKMEDEEIPAAEMLRSYLQIHSRAAIDELFAWTRGIDDLDSPRADDVLEQWIYYSCNQKRARRRDKWLRDDVKAYHGCSRLSDNREFGGSVLHKVTERNGTQRISMCLVHPWNLLQCR